MAAKIEAKREELCDALYERMVVESASSTEGRAKLFNQDELLKLGVVSTGVDLLPLLQGLANSQLLRFMSYENKTVYQLRSKDVASSLCRLTKDEMMVYTNVEQAGVTGVWTKNLKNKTGLMPNVITKVIKTLESSRLIKPVKNIKAPTQKSYILYHLHPGEEVTGGPWHSDGELDSEMIGISANVIVKFVASKSWNYKTIKVPRKRSISPMILNDSTATNDSTAVKEEPQSPEQANGLVEEGSVENKKRSAGTPEREGAARKKRKTYDKIDVQVPFPAGYPHYPTTTEIYHMLQNSGFIKNQLEEKDIQSFLDMLVMDDRLETIRGAYRTVKGVQGGLKAGFASMEEHDLEESGLTQTPCGKCPVFDLCEEGGPVNARNCEYFDAWLTA